MWKLTIEDDQANKTVVDLIREEYGIGRGEDNAIRLTERNISRSHARLLRHAQQWTMHDLSSSNGCYVNGKRVGEVHELSSGDLIQLGDYRLTVENEALIARGDSTATVPAIPRGGDTTRDRLVVIGGPASGTAFPLSQESLLIGRGEDCAISLNDPSVSRIHAELQPLGEGRYELFDKNSANGVRVNGMDLPRSFLEARDVIELGDVFLKLVPAGEIYTPAAEESLQIAAIGAARRREAHQAQSARFGGMGRKLLLVFGGAVLAIAAAVYLTRSQDQTIQFEGMPSENSKRANRVLADAKKLLAEGDARAAYQKAAELPAGSSARQSNDFKKVQAAFADHLFELAEKTHDVAERSALLDEIARSTGVDPERRNRAAATLMALRSPTVDINELPKALGDSDAEALPSAEPSEPRARSTPPASKDGGALRRAPTQAKPRASAKDRAVPIVRKNPFGSGEE